MLLIRWVIPHQDAKKNQKKKKKKKSLGFVWGLRIPRWEIKCFFVLFISPFSFMFILELTTPRQNQLGTALCIVMFRLFSYLKRPLLFKHFSDSPSHRKPTKLSQSTKTHTASTKQYKTQVSLTMATKIIFTSILCLSN